MDQTKSIKLQKKRLESAEERRALLDKANERADKKIRLEKRKVTLANESCELSYFF